MKGIVSGSRPGFGRLAARRLGVGLLLLALISLLGAAVSRAQGDAVVRMVYFYRDDCPHCIAVIDEVLKPLMAEHEERLQIKMIQMHDPDEPGGTDFAKYEMFIRAEEMLGVSQDERGIPMLIVGGQVLIGEEEIREQLSCLLDTCLTGGGTSWPDIPGLDTIPVEGDGDPGVGFNPEDGLGVCSEEEPVCEPGAAPVWAAYFYQVGCRECSLAESDIQYVSKKYQQLQIEEFNIYESVDLARWLAERAGREDDLHAPALFVGEDILVGEEITPQSVERLVQEYASMGSDRIWEEFDPEATAPPSLPGLLTVLFAGLVDGLNPCAFATLIFFVSYLAFMGREGTEVLIVGVAFALGVFLAYTLVGVGLWRLLSALPFIETLGQWLYGLIALACALLAVFSLRDYFRARQGRLEDMALVMPDGLRQHAHAVIRRASSVRAFVLVALPVGAIIALLELACTGQIYLPTIIFVMSEPALQAQAVLLLLLYNLMFILPLVVVFVLVYFGTTSMQLGLFLRRHAATVKLGTALLFAAMATWLTLTLVA